MIRFLVFTDLHYDHVPDGDARVEQLAARIERARPDFVLSLGDLCRPIAQNRAVLRRLEAAGACPSTACAALGGRARRRTSGWGRLGTACGFRRTYRILNGMYKITPGWSDFLLVTGRFSWLTDTSSVACGRQLPLKGKPKLAILRYVRSDAVYAFSRLLHVFAIPIFTIQREFLIHRSLLFYCGMQFFPDIC